MAKFLLAMCITLFTATAFADDSESKLERRFTVSSGYVEKIFNSNEGLVHFPLSTIQAYSKLFDVVSDSFKDHWGIRLATVIVEAPVAFWFAGAIATPFHEFGHARPVSAVGGTYRYGTVAYGHEFKGVTNYWSLSALRIITPPMFFPGSGGAYVDYDI